MCVQSHLCTQINRGRRAPEITLQEVFAITLQEVFVIYHYLLLPTVIYHYLLAFSESKSERQWVRQLFCGKPESIIISKNENTFKIWALIWIAYELHLFSHWSLWTQMSASGVENHCSMPCLSASFCCWCEHVHSWVITGSYRPMVTGDLWTCLSPLL